MGTAVRFSAGKHAKWSCPRCGLVVPYTSKRYEWFTQTWVCSDCLDELPVDREPIRGVVDAEPLRHPRMPAETHITYVRPTGVGCFAWTGTPVISASVILTPSDVAMAAATGTATIDATVGVNPTGLAMVFGLGSPTIVVNPGWGEGLFGEDDWGE